MMNLKKVPRKDQAKVRNDSGNRTEYDYTNSDIMVYNCTTKK